MKKTWSSKLKNFWYYYKVHTMVVLFAVVVFVPPIWDLITTPQPDYSVAVVSQREIDPAAMEALRGILEENCQDANGDGKFKLDIMYYQADLLNPAGSEVAVSRLSGDMAAYNSGIFLMDEPEAFQSVSFVLGYLDGTDPVEETMEMDKLVLPVSEISKLKGLGFDDLYLGFRMGHPQKELYLELLEKLK